MSTPEPTWLTPPELRVWQSLHTVLVLLPIALDRQLQQDSQVSYLEYYVLAALSERDTGTARLSELAVLTNAELSRISHLVARLERRGLLHRRPDPDDGRYTNAVLTDQGWTLIRAAAPGHVDTVRKLVFEGLTDTDRAELAHTVDRLVATLSKSGIAVPPRAAP
ncbi:MarR family winged helix-turn-helix transcriptional regulator [Actinoplanes sp. HUAS TT8]|uniref:MarR family winged helix-turn-helix transcriptional regulator n=1 Tax=Actinoplanes sp. HUAS TT8 TaxID=3447453 RepID=UPI003F5217F4